MYIIYDKIIIQLFGPGLMTK